MKEETGYAVVLYRISIEFGKIDELDENNPKMRNDIFSNAYLNEIIKEAVSDIFKHDSKVEIVSSRVIRCEEGCIEFIGELLIAGIDFLKTGDIQDLVSVLKDGFIKYVLDETEGLVDGYIAHQFYTYAERCNLLKSMLCSNIVKTIHCKHKELREKGYF